MDPRKKALVIIIFSLTMPRVTFAKCSIFLVFGKQRSGTTFFAEYASSIVGIELYHEIFLKQKVRPKEIPLDLWDKRHDEPLSFLKKLGDMRAKTGVIALGTIVQPWQINQTSLRRAFKQKNMKFVLLIRSNVFHQYVSNTKALMAHEVERRTGVSFYEAYQQVENEPFQASVTTFKGVASKWKSWYHYLILEMTKREIYPLVISYETMILGKDMIDLHGRLLHKFLEVGGHFEARNANLPAKREKGCPSKNILNFEVFAKEVRSLKWGPELSPVPGCLA